MATSVATAAVLPATVGEGDVVSLVVSGGGDGVAQSASDGGSEAEKVQHLRERRIRLP